MKYTHLTTTTTNTTTTNTITTTTTTTITTTTTTIIILLRPWISISCITHLKRAHYASRQIASPVFIPTGAYSIVKIVLKCPNSVYIQCTNAAHSNADMVLIQMHKRC